MLCFPSFLNISYRFPWCFGMFPLVFLRFPRVFLLFPHSVSLVSYFRFCGFVAPNEDADFIGYNWMSWGWMCMYCNWNLLSLKLKKEDGKPRLIWCNWKVLTWKFVKDKGKKTHFWKACKPSYMFNRTLMYKNTSFFISSKEWQQSIIYNVHVGLDYDSKAKAMASNRGRDVTEQNVSERFFWHNIKVTLSDLLGSAINVKNRGD